MIRAFKHGFKVTEIPADEPKRIGGVRKMRIVYNGLAVLCGILREMFVPPGEEAGARMSARLPRITPRPSARQS